MKTQIIETTMVETKNEAEKFIENYKVKYTTKGFISMFSIEALCEVL